MKLITIITPCYNEEDNAEICYRRIKELFASLGTYRYEHIFIDNASTDRTVEILRRLAAKPIRTSRSSSTPQLRPYPLPLYACSKRAATP